ncbi:MAG: bifunctional 5,10-methylenetetrahydrofolate dehydrogenase/5,10-methenyltetrahydrofolate cyclohydrolase, partial [Proteobacteria bacterium]
MLLAAKPYLDAKKNLLATRVRALKSNGVIPCLKVILVGEDPASVVYVEKKRTTAAALGLSAETLKLPSTLDPRELRKLVDHLNADPNVHGILIQRPLPKQFVEQEVLEWVSPEKDVDGLHPTNLGRLAQGNPTLISCTPKGTIELLEHYGYSLQGRLCAVVGRSPIVGRPLSQLLLYKNATLIQVHSQTPNPKDLTRLADFVFVAIGKP